MRRRPTGLKSALRIRTCVRAVCESPVDVASGPARYVPRHDARPPRHAAGRARPRPVSLRGGELDPGGPRPDRPRRRARREAVRRWSSADERVEIEAGSAIRLTRRAQARRRARLPRDRRRRPRLPRRRRLDRRLHGLPAPARRSPGRRGRRRPRTARLVAARGRAGRRRWRASTRASSSAAALPFEPELAVIDVSFISLRKLLEPVASVLTVPRRVLAMVKPQFELGRGRVGKGGVVRSIEDRREAVELVVDGARAEIGLGLRGVAPAGVPGPKGNREIFVQLADGAEAGRPGRRHRGGCRDERAATGRRLHPRDARRHPGRDRGGGAGR